MNVAGSGESEPTLNRGANVRENIAKQIVGNYHFELLWIEHHVHRHRVDVLMIRCDLRISRCDFFENTLPEIAAVALYVRLVSHRHTLAIVCSRILKRRNDNPLHSATRVYFLLERDLLGSSPF